MKRIDLSVPQERDAYLAITQEYFDWMNAEIIRHCGFSIPDIVGMSLEAYVAHTAEIGARIAEPEGGVYAQRGPDGEVRAIGGLRRLPDGAGEIVRIYTRPAYRGLGLGRHSVDHLIAEARRLGYRDLRLDTAIFMTAAQRIYHAAGFVTREPYAGAEPPPQLLPFWIFMNRRL